MDLHTNQGRQSSFDGRTSAPRGHRFKPPTVGIKYFRYFFFLKIFCKLYIPRIFLRKKEQNLQLILVSNKQIMEDTVVSYPFNYTK